MIEEHRDPELESIRAEWEAPPPRENFRARLLGAYESEFGGFARWAPWWRRRWSVSVVVVAGVGVLLAMAILRPHAAARYEPVSQPHFIIVSAGEHP